MRLEAGLNDVADFSPIPDGLYDFIIKQPLEVVPEEGDIRTDIGGKLYVFYVRPEIESGEHAGRELRTRFSNRTKGSRYYFKSFLEKIGVSVDETGGFATEDLLGRRFRAPIVQRPYEDKTTGQQKTISDIDTEAAVSL